MAGELNRLDDRVKRREAKAQALGVEVENLDRLLGQDMIVTDVRMPFWSMVVFMVKWSLASIPALIILTIFFGIIFIIFRLIGVI